MNNSIYKFSLDIHETSSQVLIELKQNDTAREFQISLTENGRPYIIEEDCYAVFTATKPDGNIINNECRIEDNTIFYTTTQQSTCVVGEVLCEIKLYGARDEQRVKALTSPLFTVLVNAAVYQDGDVIEESKNEVSTLGSLYVKTNSLYNQLTKKLENGELQGENGKSAYEIAVDNGFKGTEKEWLESLKGPGGSGLTNENYIEKVENLPTTPKENELVALVKDEIFDWDNVVYESDPTTITNKYNVCITTLPETIDLTPIKGKNIFSSIVLFNTVTGKQVIFTASKDYVTVAFDSSGSVSYFEKGHTIEATINGVIEKYTIPESGWYKIGDKDLEFIKLNSDELKVLNGIYNVALADYGKLVIGENTDTDVSTTYIINLLLNKIVVPIEKGFYVAEKGQWYEFVEANIAVDDFATKEELNDIYNVLDNLVETVGQKFSGIIDGVTAFDLTEKDFANVTATRRYAFYQNTALKNIVFPETLTGISVNSFYGCTGLLTVIMKGFTTIQAGAFNGCTGLTKFYLPDVTSAEETPTLANISAFTNTTCLFVVSSEDVKAFYVADSNWNTFAERFIVEVVE